MDINNNLCVIIYKTQTNREPFIEWFNKLDKVVQDRTDARIARLRIGIFGDVRRIIGGKGVCELRILQRSGYRIYFAYESLNTVVILLGGNKKTQTSDIVKAKQYWKEYQETYHDKKKKNENL